MALSTIQILVSSLVMLASDGTLDLLRLVECVLLERLSLIELRQVLFGDQLKWIGEWLKCVC